MPTWTVATPARPAPRAHLILRAAAGRLRWNQVVAADLAATYRDARAALAASLGCDGFTVVFALNWRPYGAGIGEPASDHDGAVHVVGRYQDETVKPSTAMSVPVVDRPNLAVDNRLSIALATELDPWEAPPSRRRTHRCPFVGRPMAVSSP